MMKINSKAPEFAGENNHGQLISLGEILDQGQHVLLVFLRHLG